MVCPAFSAICEALNNSGGRDMCLDVRFNNVLSGGRALSHAPVTLRELRLSNNAIGYTGALHLVSWMSSAGKALERLCVADCSIPSAGLCL